MSRLRVQLAHGLEGSPTGSKARFLADHFDARTPNMDTQDFAACVRVHRDVLLEFAPQVLVGSSFGGAVVIALLLEGAWRGPTVLLAPAPRPFGVEERLPEGVPVFIAHGQSDDVVDPAGSRRLSKTGTPELVRLVEVDDDHRLQSLVDSGRLRELVTEVYETAGGLK